MSLIDDAIAKLNGSQSNSNTNTGDEGNKPNVGTDSEDRGPSLYGDAWKDFVKNKTK